MIFLAMILLGGIIGFVGAGGAGVTIALLNVGFGITLHTSIAVALAGMMFTTLSGAYSHFREGEVIVKTGAVLGISGVVGAYAGANFSMILPSNILGLASAWSMIISALILYMKVYHTEWMNVHLHARQELLDGKKLYIYGIIAGTVNGFISGAFGIGAAAFIQISLMIIFGVPLIQAIGTCMMVILPISAAGGLGYLVNGQLDFMIFIQTLLGQTIGAYIGAKLTSRAPKPVLKASIVGMSAMGGIVMLLKYL